MLVSLEVIYQLKNRNGNQIQMRKNTIWASTPILFCGLQILLAAIWLSTRYLNAWVTLATPLWRRWVLSNYFTGEAAGGLASTSARGCLIRQHVGSTPGRPLAAVARPPLALHCPQAFARGALRRNMLSTQLRIKKRLRSFTRLSLPA